MKGKTYSIYWLIAALIISVSTFAADSADSKKKTDKKNERAEAASTKNKTKININTADAATLQTLPGVGPSVAQDIIAARPFKNVNELKNVRGIGDERLKDIKPLVTARKARDNSGTPAATTRGADRSQPRQRADQGRTEDPSERTFPTETRTSRNTREDRSTPPITRESNTRGRDITPPATAKININTATQEQLESLLGIGPVKAQAIIDGRPYRSIDEVMQVKGIKEGAFDDIRDRITVR